jgi:UDP-glucose 4-epimerase
VALRPVLCGADAVVHLAWGFQPSQDVAYLDRLGVEGTRAVVDTAQDEGVPHLVHLSSVGAYSPGPDPGAPGGPRVTEEWPTGGIDSLAYSIEKVAAERLLDEHERRHPDGTAVARMRPGLIVQRDAGSALLRYGMPAYLPAALLRHVRLLPLDRDFVVPLVHTDDVADAVARALERRASGAFNLAADPPVTRELVADVLGARPVHLPRTVLRTAADLAWRLRLQPMDDRAFPTPRWPRAVSAASANGPSASAAGRTSPCPGVAATSSPTSARARWTPTAAWSARGMPAVTTSGPVPWWTARRASCSTAVLPPATARSCWPTRSA